jgi:formate-dependent nitrite reductase membrane component NrfD
VAALAPGVEALRGLTVGSLIAHLGFTLAEPWLAPEKREREYRLASHLVTRGPWALQHWALGVALGVVVPLVLLVAVGSPAASVTACVLALAGLAVEENVLVRAGQALPIS